MEELIKNLKQTKSKEDLIKVSDYLKENTTTDYVKFSKELLKFILDQKIDLETQRAILLHYINQFFSMSIKSDQLSQISFEEVFKANNSMYNEISNEYYLSAYYNINYPKNEDLHFKKGDKVDFLQIEEGKYYSWIQASIYEIEDTLKQYVLQLPINNQYHCLKYDSYRIQPLNKFTSSAGNDFNWRLGLKEGDIIDALDTGNRWNKSTVLSKKEDTITVALRIYETEAKIMYTGYGELYDYSCSIYDSRIRPVGTFSPVTHFNSLYAALPKENCKFNSHSMHVPFDNTHYTIPKNKDNSNALYSLEYITICNAFISKLIQMNNEVVFSLEQIDYFISMCQVVFNLHEHLHPHFAKDFIPKFISICQQYLITFSNSDTRNFTKASIVSVIQNLKCIMEMAYYPWEISSHVSSFEITFGMNCLSSTIMEKQLLGLKIISDTLAEGTKQYSSNEKLIAISSLLTKTDKGNIFDILFKGNFHCEIIKKSSEVALLLFKLKVINKEEIDQLYQLMHSTTIKEVKDAIYEILTKGAPNLSCELLFHTVNKLYEINKEDITTNDIHLLVELTKHIPETCWYETAIQLLDFLLDIIIKNKQENLIKPFCDLISYSDKNETLIKMYLVYFEKIMKALNSEEIYVQMMLLSNLIQLIPSRIQQELIVKATGIIFSNVDQLNTLIIDFCKENKNKVCILSFTLRIIEETKSNSMLTDTFLQALLELYTNTTIDTNNNKENNESMVFFFNWLKDLQSKNMFKPETIDFLFTVLKNNQSIKDSKANPSLLKEVLHFFWHLFVSINSINPNDFKSNRLNPLQFKYVDIIWALLINSEKEEALINSFMEMFSLPWIPQKDRSFIWNQTIKQVFTDLSSSNKKNCIRILIDLIESADVLGTANSKPHASLIESTEVKIEITNQIEPNAEFTFNLTLPSSMTLFDLRLRISEKIKMPIFSFGIYRFLELEILPKLNGRTLGSLLPSETKLKVKRGDYITIERIPLTLENDTAFTPEGEKVFKEQFKAFSTNGKMSKEQNCKLIQKALGGLYKVEVNDDNVKKMFEKDDDNDGYLTEANAIDFYLDAVKNKRDDVVWKNINCFGYRNDLRHISEPFERDIYMNEDRTLMPRYILSKDPEYFNTLFELQNDSNSDISDSANWLINLIETNEGLYNEILRNTSSSYLINAQDKIFQLIYIFEIISSAICVNEKEGNESTLLKAFITSPDNIQCNKSTFEEIIGIFITHMVNLLDENKVLMQLYNLELKVIKICLENLIKNSTLSQLLLHYEKELDTPIPIITHEELSNKVASVNKDNLQLNQLIRVIIGNMKVLNNKEKLIEMKKSSLISSFQIIAITLLAFETSDQVNDLNNKILIEFLLNELKTPFEFTQRLSYVTMKMLFIQLQKKDSLVFITQNEEIITKELFQNNAALNKYNPIFVFKTYQEIIAIKQYTLEQKIQIIKDIIKELVTPSNAYTEDIIIGYCSLLHTVITSLDSIPDIIQEVVTVLINKFLINDETCNYDFHTTLFIKEVYNLLSLIVTKCKSSIMLILIFLNTKFSELLIHLTQLEDDKRQYSTIIESKSFLGYLGIKNLGAICYMISILQQFSFIKPFKYSINEVSLPLDSDTPLYQLKKMFSFLSLSNRRDYSPHEFANSFKDSYGQPINIKDQYDAQEFLSRFLDTMENILKSTQFKYLLQGVFGGESCSQLFCKNPDCDKVSNRFENMSFLSLEIKQMNTLEESLKKYIAEEQIDDFYCDKCKGKTTHSKQISINKLPNVLIIHLQRIAFDYETFQMAKIDSKLEYPKELDLKEYSTEKHLKNNNTISDDEFNSHVYEREDDYYKYKLVGVVIHTGTAQYGHYFSIVKVKSEKDKDTWLKFNDSIVSDYLLCKLDEDTFGGTQRNTEWLLDANQNAYLLFYEREKKTKIAYLINETEVAKDKPIKPIETETQLNKELDIFCKQRESEVKEDANSNQLYNLKGELIEVVDYNTISEKEANRDKQKMLFYDEVIRDNIKFNNDKKIFTKNFNEFIELAAKQLLENAEVSKEDIKDLYMKIHNIVMNIIAKSYFVENLTKIIEILIKIIKANPEISGILVKEIMATEDKWVSLYLLVQDTAIGTAFSLYLSNVILIAITSSVSESEDVDAKLAYGLIDHYLDYIPIKLSRKWSQMCFLLEIFDHLTKSKESKVIEYLISKDIIRKLSDFFLGKESPLYTKDDRTEIGNKSIKAKFAPLLSTIANILQCNSTFIPNAKDMKCLNSKQFYVKAMNDEYDNASLGKIMAYFMLNNEEFTMSRLNEMLPIINIANVISSYKNVIAMIEHILLLSDDYTQLRLENLIGIPQLSFNERKIIINYIAPLMSDKETIIAKIIKNCSNTKDFPSFTKTIYELLLNNAILLEYVKGLPQPMCFSQSNGFLKAIKANYANVLEAFNLKKDEKSTELLNSIDKLESELNTKLGIENEISNENCAFKLMIIQKEGIERIDYNCSSEELKQNLILLKGTYSFVEIDEVTFNEHNANQMIDFIDINSSSYYLNNLSTILNNGNGKPTIREINAVDSEINHTFVRYFLINNSNAQYYNISVKFNLGNTQSLLPKSLMTISIPKQSLREVMILKEYSDLYELIVIQSTSEIPVIPDSQQQPILALPSPNDNYDVCTITCSMCGEINLLDNSNPELKCKSCQIFLFQ